MRTVDECTARAPAEVCFRVAADVEGWPSILPHYRRVTFRRKEAFATGLVEMAAWRHFGPVPWPTWWVSEMAPGDDDFTVHYRHVEGITTGMDVVWRVVPVDDETCHLSIVHEWDGPRWPLIGSFAAERVIGPRFVSHIAGRTLAGVAAAAEREASS